MLTDRREHFTKLLKIANDHEQWMRQYGWESSVHFQDLKRENLANLLHRDCIPEY